MTSRRHVHTRNIRAEVFVRDDGLWDVEVELIDTKSRDFQLATGMRSAGDAIHRMRVVVTIDTQFEIVAVDAKSLAVPYPGYCETIEPDYQQLVGLNLTKGFRRAVRERLGGAKGCTHMTELTDVMPTAAIQALAGEVIRNMESTDQDGRPVKPFQLDRCHALRTDGPAVARYYPRWTRATQDIPETDPNAQRPA